MKANEIRGKVRAARCKVYVLAGPLALPIEKSELVRQIGEFYPGRNEETGFTLTEHEGALILTHESGPEIEEPSANEWEDCI